ncbi:MAG: ribose 5-phosphate isomerase B [Propionicimonas sp.]|uniref:ribose 5-phosphate isomerase B n=1 Tax=Propionicimonas sp. TaxID=1955623 RepID=UPI002B20FDC6|nr:ribose 5-phosphate isomerase B [Propionicimonas sp.]MEA4942996.1 ribose 5-phosphate isomerase B [Propionicimonas sp.]MEA5118414.1 ribose 5-phosphate isomerase B [Propionicimonas sp.]
MKLVIAGDHSSIDLKQALKEHLEARGHEVTDLGAHTTQSTDYPVWGRLAGEAVVRGDAELGIVICGTGVGISIAANKVRGVRAACVSEPFSAQMSRRHNDANVLALGARVVGVDLAKMIVDSWLDAEFEAGGRHSHRVGLITEIDEEYRAH